MTANRSGIVPRSRPVFTKCVFIWPYNAQTAKVALASVFRVNSSQVAVEIFGGLPLALRFDDRQDALRVGNASSGSRKREVDLDFDDSLADVVSFPVVGLVTRSRW